MGNLFLINDSFELANHSEANRDKILLNFCKAIDLAKKDKDCLYATSDIYSRQFSYGSLFFDFFYKSWPEFIQNQTLKGISSTTYNLNFSLLYAIPGMTNIIDSSADFEQQFMLEHKGFAGFEMETQLIPYICSLDNWQSWKFFWLSLHQEQINWSKYSHEYLPNKAYSDNILLNEIMVHNKEDELEKNENNIGQTFHDEVMRHKGPEIPAYTKEIGEKILSANFYLLQSDLTKNEQRASGNSFREIYRLLGPEGEFIYISLDHRHGMFEYHNHHGDHLGEYKFDGSFNSNADPNHNLKTL